MSQSLEQGKRKLTAKDAITAGALGAVVHRHPLCLYAGRRRQSLCVVCHPLYGCHPDWAGVHADGCQGAKERPLSAHQPCHRHGAGSRPPGCSPSPGWWGGLLCELCLRAGQFRRRAGWCWASSASILDSSGTSCPCGSPKRAIGVCRPDDGCRLYDHHGGPADLAGVRDHRTEYPGGFHPGRPAGHEAHAQALRQGRAGTMRAPAARGSFLDPRTKILIWLLANVVGVHLGSGGVPHRRDAGLLRPILLERKGKMLAACCWSTWPSWQYSSGCCRCCPAPLPLFLPQ